MSEVENKPVEVPVTETAPAAEPTPAVEHDDSKIVDVTEKKADKKSLLAKLKAIIKKVLPGKKEKAAPTTEEPASDAAVPAEPAPAAAPTTTAAA